MPKEIINKIDAARRQTDTAIRMHFANEDYLAVHTLSAAAFGILKDIATKQGNCDWHEERKTLIRPEKKSEYWALLNKAANFLKHANSDPDGTLKFNEKMNDYMIFQCYRYYISMGYKASLEMESFNQWFALMYPHLLDDRDSQKSFLSNSHHLLDIKNLSRQKQLEIGQNFLVLLRSKNQ